MSTEGGTEPVLAWPPMPTGRRRRAPTVSSFAITESVGGVSGGFVDGERVITVDAGVRFWTGETWSGDRAAARTWTELGGAEAEVRARFGYNATVGIVDLAPGSQVGYGHQR